MWRYYSKGWGKFMKYIVIILVIVFAYLIFSHFRTRAFLNILTEEQFRQGYRKAQLIDVREPQEFERGHILGARNIPMTQLKSRLVELRKDKPVYLYCQGISRSNRAANILRKNGYQDINVLQGGFSKWTGRIKY